MGSAVEGRLFPASFCGFIVGVLVCGYLSDRWGRKAVLLAAIAAYGFGLVITSIVPVFNMALLAAALIGAGSGAIETVASALAADLYPERRALLLNAIQIAFGAGAAIGPFAAHTMLAHGIDWRTLYMALAGAQLVLFVLFALQQSPLQLTAPETIDFGALRRVLGHPIFLALCIAQALYVGAEVAFAAWMPTYFRDSLPGGVAWEGLVGTIFWIAMTVGRIAVTQLIGRISLLRLAIVLSIGGSIGSAITTAWTVPWIVICAVAWTGLCFSGIFGLILAEAGTRYPAVSGSAFGAITASGGVGGAVLPWAVALLSVTSMHWRGALLLVPISIGGVAAVLSLITRRPSYLVDAL